MPTSVNPVTKYRGHSTVPDSLPAVANAYSVITGENSPSEFPGFQPSEISEQFVAAFLDQHCGYAYLNVAVTGTAVNTGDQVSLALTGPTAVGSASVLSGGLSSQAAVNALVSGNVVTPNTYTASYSATSGDAGQGTLALRLQAVATGLVAAINASSAVTGPNAFLATVAAPVAGAFTLVALLPGGGGALPGYVAGITINAAATATPGGAGHATLSPLGATNPFVPQNANLHVPTNDGQFAYPISPYQSAYITLTGSEPILLDPAVYAYATAQGIAFNF